MQVEPISLFLFFRYLEAGSTVIYTSHYMEEIEELCSLIMIMDHGRKIASGTVEELKALIGTGEKVVVELDGAPGELVERVRRLDHVRAATLEDGVLHVECLAGRHNLADVLATITAAGASYGRVLSEPPTLNEVFLEITGRELRDET